MPRVSIIAFVTIVALVSAVGGACAQSAPDQTAPPTQPATTSPTSGGKAQTAPADTTTPQPVPPKATADSVEIAAPAPPPQNCPQDECPTPQ